MRIAARSTALPTGVAMFDAEHRLTFYNAAYRALWDLDAAYLDQKPTDSAVIDELRAARQTAGGAGLPAYGRPQLHEAYRAIEAKEHTWHLPDGRTLRVVTTPNPDGGVTYLFHDVTERLDLERRFEELIRVQGETLDNLAEGVAVFAQRRPRAAAQSGLRADVAAVAANARRAAAHRNRSPRCASRCTATMPRGRRCARW